MNKTRICLNWLNMIALIMFFVLSLIASLVVTGPASAEPLIDDAATTVTLDLPIEPSATASTVPSEDPQPAATSTSDVAVAPAPVDTTTPASKPVIVVPAPQVYTVQSGDWLSTIAPRFGTTVSNLAALNCISDPDVIHVGTMLKIDGASPVCPVVAKASKPKHVGAPAPNTTPADKATGLSSKPVRTSTKINCAGRMTINAPDQDAANALAYACSKLGSPYTYGASLSSNAFDCSSLLLRAWAKGGVQLPRVSSAQINVGTPVTMSQLLPGDLVHMNGHIGMDIGNGMMIHAPNSRSVVKISKYFDDQSNGDYWGRNLTRFTRVQKIDKPVAAPALKATAATAAPAPVTKTTAPITTTPAPQPVPKTIAVPATTQRVATPTAKSGTVWDRLANCESGGNWAINTGNGYYGGLQFNLATWRSVGGSGMPHQATKGEQIKRANILHAQRGYNPWPACKRTLGL